MKSISSTTSLSFLQGGGQMGELTRNISWAQTSLGTPDTWPQTLRTTLGILLHSSFPMFLCWGEELLCFYNDAFRPSLGNDGKHPAVGKKAKEVWADVWEFAGPLVNQVLTRGEAVHFNDQLVPFYRNGQMESIYWSFSFSPVYGDGGKIEGVFIACNETTKVVTSAQQLSVSDQRFKNLVRDATVGIIVLMGPEMKVSIVNEAYSRMIGRTTEELMDKELFAVIPETEDFFRPIINKVRLHGEPIYLYDQPYFVYAGEKKMEGYLNLVYQPYKEVGGAITGVMVLCHDVTAQVVASKKVEESVQQLRSVVESAPFPIGVYVGREMRIQLANKSIMDVWDKGYEVVGKLYSELLPELDNQPIFQQLDEVYTTGIPFHAKNQRVDIVVDGKLQPFYFNYSFTPLFDASGNVYGVMNTAAETTDLNRAKQKIEESEERFRLAIDASKMGTFEVNLLTGEAITSERLNEIYDIDTPEQHYRYIKAIHPTDVEIRNKAFEEAYKTGLLDYEVRILWRNNAVRWVKALGKISFNEDGKPARIVGVVQDITQRKETEMDLRNAAENLQLALDAGKLGSFVYQLPGRSISYTPQFKKNFGLSEEEDINYDELSNLVFEEDREKVQKVVNDALANHMVYNIEYRIKWPDGKLRWIKSSGRPMYTETNELASVIGINIDITEQKLFAEELRSQVRERTEELQSLNEELTATNEELEEANDQLMEANRELEQFTYAASHDMQEPLRKVHTFSSFLLENHADNLDDRGKSYLTKISASVSRMKNIIDDLLNYSHQTREEQIMESVNLNKIIEDVEADLELVIQQKGASIKKAALPVVNANASQMTQLFYNLFSNALKFSKGDVPPQITVLVGEPAIADKPHLQLLDQRKNYCKITVSDNGIGFEQEHAEQIFGLFRRLHGKNEYEGTGIGLGLVKKIVLNHHGAIWAESKPGEGARFYIVLPV